MSTITAAEIKRKGVSALGDLIADEGEAVITVRGKEKYVVMTMDAYNHLREAELVQAVHEAREDYEAGRIADDTVEAHIQRLKNEV